MRLTVYFPEDSPTTHEFVGSKLTVGRLGDNDVRLDDGSVSGHHAELVVREGITVLVDKESTTGTFLNETGRRRFWEAWFRRMDGEVSHPHFGYKMSYRRMLEVQARQLWRVARGDTSRYHAFTTR